MKFGKVFKSKFAKVTAAISAPLGAIALVLGLVNDLPGAYGLFANRSGSVALTYKGEKVENVGERHVIVCLDSVKSASKLTGIYPVFSNNTSYGVNNFAMRYVVESQGVEIAPSDFYSMSQGEESDYVLKYKETLLPAFTAVERPIKNFYVAENGGHLRLSAHASYDGIDNPIVYDVYTNFYVVPYRGSVNYEDWKRQCQRKFLSDTRDIQECDVYYLTQRNGFEQEINFRLGDLIQDKPEPTENIAFARPVTKKTEPVAKPDLKPKTEPKPAPVAKPEPKPVVASESLPLPFALRIDDTDRDTVEVYIDDVVCDTTMLMLILLEDTVSHNKSNDLWPLSVKSQRRTIYREGMKAGRRVADYAFCRENPALRDSVKMGSDSTVTNDLSRSIAVLASRDSGTWNKYRILKPDGRMDYSGFGDVRFYELPEELLVDEYKLVSDNDNWGLLEAGNIVGIIFVITLLLVILLFVVFTLTENRKKIKSFSDAVRYLTEEFGFTKDIYWQLPLSFIVAYLAGFAVTCIILLFAVLFISIF